VVDAADAMVLPRRRGAPSSAGGDDEDERVAACCGDAVRGASPVFWR